MTTNKKITRRQFIKGLLPFGLMIVGAIACGGDDVKKSKRKAKKRNKWLKKTGKDKVKPGNGKDWGDKKGKKKKDD